jgi:hypothetical protein
MLENFGRFPMYPGARGVNPIAINNGQQILVTAQLLTGRQAWFVYDNGVYYRVNNPPGFRWTAINGINDLGQLIGMILDESQPEIPGVFHWVIATPY